MALSAVQCGSKGAAAWAVRGGHTHAGKGGLEGLHREMACWVCCLRPVSLEAAVILAEDPPGHPGGGSREAQLLPLTNQILPFSSDAGAREDS